MLLLHAAPLAPVICESTSGSDDGALLERCLVDIDIGSHVKPPQASLVATADAEEEGGLGI